MSLEPKHPWGATGVHRDDVLDQQRCVDERTVEWRPEGRAEIAHLNGHLLKAEQIGQDQAYGWIDGALVTGADTDVEVMTDLMERVTIRG